MTPSTALTFSTWVTIEDSVSCSWVWRSLSAVEADNHADTDVADDGRVDPGFDGDKTGGKADRYGEG
jgi:hypothetical protein